ncbi:MAG: ABC transporter ATP-binding protein [Acidimicrobiia bacterium]
MTATVSNISVQFGTHTALSKVDLSIDSGERFAVMGPSGAGKTTLLRVLAGLDRPDEGSIVLDGTDITALPAHARGIGLMFQDYALFPHMSVLDNVAYGLKMQGLQGAERSSRARELLELVGLSGYEERAPESLSGGEQQRVALARTLAPKPTLVLFDEPLGSVDSALKDTLLSEMRSAVDAVGAMAVYVTHDRAEAEAFADRLAIMRDGRVVRSGTPMQIWSDPRTTFVAGFIGHRNIVPGGVVELDAAVVVIPQQAITLDSNGSVSGTVAACTFNEGSFVATVAIDDQYLYVETSEHLAESSDVRLGIDSVLVQELVLDEV